MPTTTFPEPAGAQAPHVGLSLLGLPELRYVGVLGKMKPSQARVIYVAFLWLEQLRSRTTLPQQSPAADVPFLAIHAGCWNSAGPTLSSL